MVKNLPAMQETRVGSLGPLEKGMATHSKILAWRIPWTEEAGGLPSTGSTEPDPAKQQERCSHYAHSHPAGRTRSQGRPTGGRLPHPFSRRLTQQRRPGGGDTPLSLSQTVVQQAPTQLLPQRRPDHSFHVDSGRHRVSVNGFLTRIPCEFPNPLGLSL